MKYKTFISLIALIAVIALVVIHRQGQSQPIQAHNQSQTIKPCSNDAAACIEITLQGGEKYRLNDFNFEPHNCIDFISLPDKQHHNFCGQYTLNWIGPSNVQQQTI